MRLIDCDKYTKKWTPRSVLSCFYSWNPLQQDFFSAWHCWKAPRTTKLRLGYFRSFWDSGVAWEHGKQLWLHCATVRPPPKHEQRQLLPINDSVQQSAVPDSGTSSRMSGRRAARMLSRWRSSRSNIKAACSNLFYKNQRNSIKG